MTNFTLKTNGKNTLVISKDNLPVDILSRTLNDKNQQKELGEIVGLFQTYLADLIKKLIIEENIEQKLWELLSKLQTIEKDFITEIAGGDSELALVFLEQAKIKGQNLKEALNNLNLKSENGLDGLYIDYDNYSYQFNR